MILYMLGEIIGGLINLETEGLMLLYNLLFIDGDLNSTDGFILVDVKTGVGSFMMGDNLLLSLFNLAIGIRDINISFGDKE